MKRYLIKLSDDKTKRENSLFRLRQIGLDKIELCSKLMNIYVVEASVGLLNLIDKIPDIEVREEDECGFGI